MKGNKKVLTLILSVMMIVSYMPTFAYAESGSKSPEEVDSGTCGADLTWTITGEENDLTLTISGTGTMTDYGSIESVPWYENASKIKTVMVGEGVTTIGTLAFKHLRNISEIVLPSTLTSIGMQAFQNCSKLESITIAASVTSIGINAFLGAMINQVHIDSLEAWLNISFKGNYSNPGGRLYLQGEEVTDLVIPEGTNRIGTYAFRRCSSITRVTIPEGVTSIGFSAFSGCSNLADITIPGSVTAIEYYAFSGCSSLADITIPSGVTSINDETFNGCSNLADITIPDSVTTIGYGAFYDCSSLADITIPGSVTTIGGSAFSGCSSLADITIPSGVTSIDDATFDRCSSLADITIPGSVTTIGNRAFYGCSSLTGITIPGSVTTIGGSAFSDCSSLADITIPGSVTTIGYRAFSGCSGLNSVRIPDAVTDIGENAFTGCEGATFYVKKGSFADDYLKDIAPEDRIVHTCDYGHLWETDYTVDVPASCLEEGLESIHCSICGESKDVRSIPLADHVYVESEVITPATCTVDGEASCICEICGKTEIGAIPATGHDWGDWTVTTEPTCADKGVETRVCANDPSHTETREVPENGIHSWDNGRITTEPGCETEGVMTYTCTVCGDTRFESVETLGHTYTDTIIAPTYETGGYALHECTRCGHTYTDNETDPLIRWSDLDIHNYAAFQQLRSKIMTEYDGDYSHEPIQGAVFEIKEDEGSLNFSLSYPTSSITTVSEFTIDSDGSFGEFYYSYIFHSEPRACAYAEVTADPSLFNTNSERTYDLDFTITDKGIYYAFSDSETRSKANSMLYTLLLTAQSEMMSHFGLRISDLGFRSYGNPKEDHVLLTEEAKEPTCSEPGHSAYTYCSICGAVKEEYEITQPTGMHTWEDIPDDEDEIRIEPACLSSGIKTQRCSVCGRTETVVVPALGHDYKNTGVDATCTEGGYALHECTRCGDSYRENYEALGHNYIETVIEPTCVQNGYTLHKCTRCNDHYTSNETDSKGHSFGEWIVDNDSTCTGKGSKHRACAVCGVLEYDEIDIDTGKHNFSEEYTVDQPATCTTDGSESRHCLNDGCEVTTDSRVVKSPGHQYTLVVITPETCTDDGAGESVCSVCGEKEEAVVVIPAHGHSYSAWTTTTAATEIAEGKQIRVCSECGDTQTKKIAQRAPTLPAVKITKPKAAKKSATVKWKKVSKANQKKIANIQIQYSPDKTFKTRAKTVTAKKTAASRKITKLASKKTYYIRIRAYKKDAKGVHVSKWSTVKSVKAK